MWLAFVLAHSRGRGRGQGWAGSGVSPGVSFLKSIGLRAYVVSKKQLLLGSSSFSSWL